MSVRRAGRFYSPHSFRFALAVFLLASAASPAIGQTFRMDEGRKLYETHCRSCHGMNGEPRVPGAPDMRRGEGLLKSDGALFRSIMDGSASMPGYRGIFTEKETLNIISYIRMFY